jgi:hypothetical protein
MSHTAFLTQDTCSQLQCVVSKSIDGFQFPIQLSWIRGLSENYYKIHFATLFRQFMRPKILEKDRKDLARNIFDFSKAQSEGFVVVRIPGCAIAPPCPPLLPLILQMWSVHTHYNRIHIGIPRSLWWDQPS